MGGDQMPGSLRDRGLKGFICSLGGAQRRFQFATRAPGLANKDQREHQDQHSAGEIDPQQDASGEPRFCRSFRKQPVLVGREPFEVRADRLHRCAAFRAGRQRCYSRGVAGCVKPDKVAAHFEPPGEERFGAFEQSRLGGIVPGRRDQLGESRCDLVTGLLVFLHEVRVIGEHKATGRAFCAANQQLHVRNVLQHPKRMIDPSRIGSRLDVETDRRRADDQKNGETCSKNDPL